MSEKILARLSKAYLPRDREDREREGGLNVWNYFFKVIEAKVLL